MEPGFVKAQTDNLPKIDMMMLASFFGNNPDFVSAEIRGQKLTRSARESYGDKAIGYVQVRREGDMCIVKARITPEHSVRKTAYRVSASIDEKEEVIQFAKCDDCAASQGGCKHAVAFVTWLHRRSEEPPRTSVTCYWKKSKLAAVGTSQKFVRASALGDCPQIATDDKSFLEKVKEISAEVEQNNKQLTKYFKVFSNTETLSLHYQLLQYKLGLSDTEDANADEFINYAKQFMAEHICIEGYNMTKDQSDNPLWHEMRFARITASKVYSVVHCQTPEGTLVETILGSYKIKDNPSMKRGRLLEDSVLQVVQKARGIKFQACGLMLVAEYPVMGASPDAISDTFVVEVKCPSTDKSFKTYMTKNNEIAAKYRAQIQMQMHFLKKNRGLFCIAHPDFEKSKNVRVLEVDYEADYCELIITQCMEFWKKYIFPVLIK